MDILVVLLVCLIIFGSLLYNCYAKREAIERELKDKIFFLETTIDNMKTKHNEYKVKTDKELKELKTRVMKESDRAAGLELQNYELSEKLKEIQESAPGFRSF